MIAYLVYIFSFASNLIIIGILPKNIESMYLSMYTASNAIFSLLFFLIFSQKKLLLTVVNQGWAIVLVSLVSLVFQSIDLMLFLYPALLIFVEYLYSQSRVKKDVLLMRLLLVLDALCFVFIRDLEGFLLGLSFRMMLLMVLIIFSLISKPECNLIKLKKKYKFIACNYLYYYLPFAMLVLFYSKVEGVKYWYIVFQVGLVFILKTHDYVLRTEVDVNKMRYVYFLSFLPLVCMLFYSLNFELLALYIFSALALISNFRFVEVRGKNEISPN